MNNKVYNRILYCTLSILIIILFWLLWQSCERSNDSSQIGNIKQEITRKKLDRDSIIFRVDTITKFVDRIKIKYKTIRYDSLIPCEEKLVRCDTLISDQDTLIQVYKSLARQDSLIITQQDTLIKLQDLTISDLTKSVKKERRKRKLITATSVLITALIVGIMAK